MTGRFSSRVLMSGYRRLSSRMLMLGVLICLVIMVLLTFCNTVQEQDGRRNQHRTDEKRYKIETNLFVVILSAPTHAETRNVIRETWASNVPIAACVRFVIGRKNAEDSVLEALKDEDDAHHDLMMLDDLEESYSSLTKKLLLMLKWTNEHVKFNFLLKADEDSFVRIDKILDELLTKPRHKLYWGFFDGRAHVRKVGKWAEKNFVLCDRYLPYALGGGYVISCDLVQYVAANAELLQLFNSEDVSLGTWLGPLNINRMHDPNFDTEYKSRGCFDSYIVTHKKSPSDMQSLHENIRKYGSICETEFRVRKSYIYNWTSLSSQCCQRVDPSIP